jgi:hypothetical protein
MASRKTTGMGRSRWFAGGPVQPARSFSTWIRRSRGRNGLVMKLSAPPLAAFEAGKPDVEDDGVGPRILDGFEPLHTIARRGDLNAEHAQAHLDESPHGGRVLDDEYTLFHVVCIGRSVSRLQSLFGLGHRRLGRRSLIPSTHDDARRRRAEPLHP